MNEFLNLKLSKLLKEKGFDEVTNYIYSEVYGCVENINSLKHSDGSNRFISAPTISDVVMWLYKKHGIWVWVQTKIKEDGSDDVWFIPNGRNLPIKTKGVYEIDPIPYTPKNTPTEAYESAIEHCLTKLIK